MDDKNKQLVALLSANSRESTAELARKLNLSRTAVHERIKKLENTGVIRGYSLRLNKEYLRNLITAHVMIAVNPKLAKQVVSTLRRLRQVQALYAINGEYDLVALIREQTTEDLDDILDQLGEIDGIEKTLSSIVLSTKFER